MTLPAEVVLAPGEAAHAALRLRHFRLFAQLSRDDFIRLCRVAAKGSGAGRWGLRVQWRNGSQTDVAELEHLNELQEPGEVDTVTAFWQYSDGSQLDLGASDGIVLIKADPLPDAISRKRFHELKNDLTTLPAPKRRTPFMDLKSASMWLPGTGLGMAIGALLLGRVDLWLYLALEVVVVAIGVGLAMYRFYSKRTFGPSWLVISYRERRKVNWALVTAMAAAATVVVMVLQWIAPRGTP